MNTAKVVPNNPQSNGSFQVVEFLADSVRLSGIAPIMHSHAQVATLNMRSRDVRPIGASGFHFGDCGNDGSASVPLWACLGTSVNLLKLSKVNIGSIPLFNGSNVSPQGITGDLVVPSVLWLRSRTKWKALTVFLGPM